MLVVALALAFLPAATANAVPLVTVANLAVLQHTHRFFADQVHEGADCCALGTMASLIARPEARASRRGRI
jgi:hypothetical protein